MSSSSASVLPDVGVELREGYAAVGDQSLHYVEAGDGPLIVLLHGFPEFWFGWRLQIAPLVAAGFRVLVPDTRGYNLSSKPEGFAAYGVDLLAADIRGLIEERAAESALLVGHDWGGSIAWTVAMNHPEVVDRLAILNAAHPRRLSEGLRNPNQLRKSWYFFFFAVPGLPEDVVHARGWHFFRHFLDDANPAYTPREIERYVEAWSQPGAAAGMINYYRASVRQSQKQAVAKLRPVSAPTLVIWGERDSYLGSELAEPDRGDVPNLDRVVRVPDASHWVHHDASEQVTRRAPMVVPVLLRDRARTCRLRQVPARVCEAHLADRFAEVGLRRCHVRPHCGGPRQSGSRRDRDSQLSLAAGLAEGEPRCDNHEHRLAEAPAITVPTIANGAPHPEPSTSASKFSGSYSRRTIEGEIGHNLPQEAPEAFAQAVIDVDRY